MPAFCDPHFLVYGQNRIQSFLYMDRILEFVHIRENNVRIPGNTDEKKPTFRRSATQRISYQNFDQNQPMPKNCQIQRGLRY